METILIAGGSGLVGNRLIELLGNKYRIKILSRNPRSSKGNVSYHKWDFNKMTIDQEALYTDHIVNLTGAGIADKRWTNNRKKILIESRVKSNELLLHGIKKYQSTIKTFTCASAIGFYGNRGDEQLTEESTHGDGFLSKCSVLWENSADLLSGYVQKLSKIRIGIVLTTKGGALPKILMTRHLGVLSYFGNGQQYYSWIHIDDLCQIFMNCINDKSYSGVLNAVAPQPITNKNLITQIKKGIGSNALVVPAPAFGLRVAMGEMADVVLNSTRVLPTKLNHLGFHWHFPQLEEAAKDLVDRSI